MSFCVFTSNVWEFQLLSILVSTWCNLARCAVAIVVQSLNHVWPFVTPWTPEHARLLCPPPSPRVCPNSPLRRWRYLTVSSSAAPFSSCLQSFPALGSLSSKCVEGSNYVLSLQFLSDLITPNIFNSYLPINVALIFNFLIISYIGHISIWLLVIWITSFVKCLFR